MYTKVGVIPYRIGRLWRPYILDKLDPRYLKHIMSLKKHFDPNNIMNPGVSVFEEEYK
jgi:FAD/FMN-containing dehydrogenase